MSSPLSDPPEESEVKVELDENASCRRRVTHPIRNRRHVCWFDNRTLDEARSLLILFSRVFVLTGSKKAANRTAIKESAKDDYVDYSCLS